VARYGITTDDALTPAGVPTWIAREETLRRLAAMAGTRGADGSSEDAATSGRAWPALPGEGTATLADEVTIWGHQQTLAIGGLAGAFGRPPIACDLGVSATSAEAPDAWTKVTQVLLSYHRGMQTERALRALNASVEVLAAAWSFQGSVASVLGLVAQSQAETLGASFSLVQASLRAAAAQAHDMVRRLVMPAAVVLQERFPASLGVIPSFTPTLHSGMPAVAEVVERFIAGPDFERQANHDIRQLSERGRARDAWNLAKWASARRPDSQLLRRWAEVLRPVPARAAGPATGHRRDREEKWLREHAREYEGQWIALLGERLIAAGPCLSAVRGSVRTAGCAADVLLHLVPRLVAP